MPQFYTLLTDVGQAKLANAIALGQTIEIAELAVGDGGGSLPTPDSSASALINEIRRAPINTSIVDPDNPSWIVVEQVLPPDVGGWTIREIGIIDADGDLIGIGNYPETYKPVLAEGSSRTQTVRFVLEVSDTAAVTLRVDPSVVLATRDFVEAERAAHEAGRNHPGATELAQGMIQRATSPEAQAGNNNTKAMTPKRTHQAFNYYGLGTGKNVGAVDLDSLINPGFYTVPSNATNMPIAADGTVVVSGNTGQPVQFFTAFATSRTFKRSLKTPGDFNSWTWWFEVGGGVATGKAIFDTAGVSTWTVPEVLKTGARKARVTVIGGGGGGVENGVDCGGGGGGGLAVKLCDLSGVSSVEVTVGAGGVKGDQGGGAQGGASSSFGAYVSASGGGRGTSSGYRAGAYGGQGIGGDFNSSLGPGSAPHYDPSSGGMYRGGHGGGPGGRGAGYADNVDASPALGPGGGGGGGNSTGTRPATSGADGMVMIEW